MGHDPHDIDPVVETPGPRGAGAQAAGRRAAPASGGGAAARPVVEPPVDEAGAPEPDPLDLLDIPETDTVEKLGPLVWAMSALMIVIGIVTSILMFQGFESDSYIYLAFYSIPANTAISVFPHEPVLIYFGKVGELLPTALWASAGTLVAGIMDHVVFVPVLNHQNIRAYKDKKFYRKVMRYFLKWPFWTLVLTGFTPIPFFPFKFLCFSVGYPMWRYVTALLVARFPRYYLYALLGATIPIPNWVLIASVAFIFGLYGVKAVPMAIEKLRARRAESRTAGQRES
ncbi:MAG: VTT domain-containing protein [Gemmatimonadota bacterium]|nr:VTT domain-containing protein [Gemmatimonadota bacterium]